ncbi:MAG: hypothetical protein FJY07_02600 [Bacteroidetes bacterium]|nr:hypothetical protein [Bacteroidota bacterium]
MKKALKILLIAGIFIVLPLAMSAQVPPHPNNGGGPGSGNIPVGGGAPIDGGLTTLFLMGLIYGAKRTSNFKKGS